MKVTVLVSVATIEPMIAHHGIVLPRDEVVLDRVVRLREVRAEGDDAGHVDDEDGEVERVHGSAGTGGVRTVANAPRPTSDR